MRDVPATRVRRHGRMGLHLAVHAGVHQYVAGAHRTPAGHPGPEGQLARRDRAGAQQPLARRRRRRAGGDARQSSLRQVERPHRVAAGHAAAVDGDRSGGRFPRCPRRRVGPDHPGRAGRLVHRAALLQRAARGRDRGAPRPGAHLATWHGGRDPRRLCAHCVGDRHLRRRPVHRQPGRDVPGPLRDRRVLHPALRRDAGRSPTRPCGQAAVGLASVRRHLLRRAPEEPGLRLGLRQPLHVRAGVRVLGDLRDLLPAGQARQRRG